MSSFASTKRWNYESEDGPPAEPVFFFETAWEARFFCSRAFFSWHVVFFPMTTKQPCFETHRQPANIAFCRNRYSKHLFFSAYLTLPTGIILLDLDKRPTWVQVLKKERRPRPLGHDIPSHKKKYSVCLFIKVCSAQEQYRLIATWRRGVIKHLVEATDGD